MVPSRLFVAASSILRMAEPPPIKEDASELSEATEEGAADGSNTSGGVRRGVT